MFHPEMMGVGSVVGGLRSMPRLKSPPSHFRSDKQRPCLRFEQNKSGCTDPVESHAARVAGLGAMQRPKVGLAEVASHLPGAVLDALGSMQAKSSDANIRLGTR